MKASVIIPTYNRSRILELTLSSLARQDMDPDEYEVIVIDDGSSDNTREVAEGFKAKFNITYHFQEDKGYRVALARNEGIKRAQGDILIFLDSGMVVGHSFVREHYAAHTGDDGCVRTDAARKVVIGYVFGYDYDFTEECIPEIINFNDPDTTLRELERTHQYRDIRGRLYGIIADDIGSLPAPWVLFWTTNVSVEKSIMLEVGCFDEEYITWGIEDTECGYRLFRKGAVYELSRKACGVHYPHGRESYFNRISNECNKRRFFKKNPNTDVELYMAGSDPVRFNTDYQNYLMFQRQISKFPKYSDMLTADGAHALAQELSSQRNIVFGCQDGFLLGVCGSTAGIEHDSELAAAARVNYPTVDIQQLVGCQTFYAAKQFEASLIAGCGCGMPEPLLTGMMREAERISRKVYWLRTPMDINQAGIKCRWLKDLGKDVSLHEITELPRRLF